MRFIISILAVLILSHCTVLAQQKLSTRDLVMLKDFMSGSFSSAQQAREDSDYFEILLHMTPIWNDRKDGFWLYVEQATAASQDKPYRQRVYHVQLLNDSLITSAVFEMSNPLRFAGAWKKEDPLATLTPDSLQARTGCTIFLRKDMRDHFYGETPGKECISNLKGAAYATSEVIIQPEMLLSWDRGWDAKNKQVWGAEKGGYQFVKQR